MSKCRDCNKCKDDHCPCDNKCDCNDEHNYYHKYSGGGRPHPMDRREPVDMVAPSDTVSTRDWSKVPAQNSEIGGVYIGCNMSGSDYPLAIQAIAAGVASLTADVGAGATWAQFETIYALRKYEGDADCIFTLKPKPKAWVLSEVKPAPAEGPTVQRDCLARTWVTCESKFDTCEVTEANGLTTYTFKQTLGDGTVINGGDLTITVPTILGLPDFPEKSGANDTTEYTLCQSPCVNDGEPYWAEKPEQPATATDSKSGLVRFVTDAEFDAGTFPAGTVLTPEQTCAKIDEAISALSIPADILTAGDLTKVGGEITAINGCPIASGGDTGGGGTDTGGGDGGTDPGGDTCEIGATKTVRITNSTNSIYNVGAGDLVFTSVGGSSTPGNNWDTTRTGQPPNNCPDGVYSSTTDVTLNEQDNQGVDVVFEITSCP